MARPLKKNLLLWTRTLHIYGSMLALILLLFFSFTGFVMNHPGWFDIDSPRVTDTQLQVPPALAASKSDDRKLQLVEYLRKQGARGEMTDYDEEDDSLRIQFTAAGRKMEYAIPRDTGAATLHDEYRNTLALLSDLHKGTGSGDAWRRVIDFTAIFLFGVSVSGLILWISLPKRRKLGLIALGVSLAACAAIFWFLIP